MSFLLNLFLPHHGNNFKAHAIKTHFLLILCVSFVALQGCLSILMAKDPDVLGYSANISPEKIVELTNSERLKLGLNSLRLNSLLSEAARQKAADMFAFNYWAHVSPSGRTPWSFFTNVGYKYQYAGENLARDFRDPQAVVTAWMNSPTHRDNIVNSKYQEIGVAVVDGSLQGTETTLVVQLFGTTFGATPVKTAESKPTTQPVPTIKPTSQPALVVLEIIPTEALTAEPSLSTSVADNDLVFSTKEVLAKTTGHEVPFTNPLDTTKAIAIFIVGILIGVFAADALIVSHRQTPRFTSRSLAQMLFLVFVLAMTLLLRQGVIL